MVEDRPDALSFEDRHILVLEDEPLILMMFEDELAEMGFSSVDGVADSSAAMALLDGKRIDLAILDIHLAGKNTCFEVATRLKSAAIPFVFATGSGGNEVPEAFLGAGFISKPFRHTALRDALVQALSGVPDTDGG